MKAKQLTCVWIAYARRPPYLPVAVADTVDELAEMMGTSKNTVYSTWSKYKAGKLKKCRYCKVLLIDLNKE